MASEKATEASSNVFRRIIGKAVRSNRKANKYCFRLIADQNGLQASILTCSVQIVEPQPLSEQRSSGEGDRSDDSNVCICDHVAKRGTQRRRKRIDNPSGGNDSTTFRNYL